MADDPTERGGSESPTEESSGDGRYAETPDPERIGPYRILRKIGEGGMGVVYEAEQEEPLRRRIAVKLIKWGMDTKQVVARFTAERQTLALMSHPNVAKVFDAGATREGRPYFVMEYVKGVPITEHCDRQRLTTKERLELFMQACEGVQHAHQKGIIHRDIKPSNILVAVENDKASSKVIDFGVAKATAQRLTERTLFTELGQLVGTPEYMSPEQAEMTAQDIDTRTDVYSLGVVLYELLVGALPFDPTELRQGGFHEIRRKIREDQPSKPSTRVSTAGDASTALARNRRTDPRSLARQLRGDLDWITMKALEKSRTRRYASTTELLADLARHLNNEAVLAGPPSSVYRIVTFARRHKSKIAAGAAVVLAALVTTGIVIITGLGRLDSRVAQHEEPTVRVATQAELRRTLEVLESWDKKILEETLNIRNLLTTAGSHVPPEDRQRFAETLARGQEEALVPSTSGSGNAELEASREELSARELRVKAQLEELVQLRTQLEEFVASSGTSESSEAGRRPVPGDGFKPAATEEAEPARIGDERVDELPPEDDPDGTFKRIQQSDVPADENTREAAVLAVVDPAWTEAAGPEPPMTDEEIERGAEAAGPEPTTTDEEIERFLLKAKVVASEELGTGITKPWKVTLELDGKTMRAVFKDVDVYKPGVTKFPGGKSEMNFSDKYVYERAAYLLDRRLGMNMVPVAVNRQWRSKSGAMVEWVENAIKENKRLDQSLEPDDPVLMDYQKAIMRLFDALIYNVDRNQTNMLYTRDDWNLHLIDHTRSFRRTKDLQETFTAKPASLPRSLFEELEAMDENELKALLKNLVTGPQIKAMMQRRDLILQKIADDRESYGDNLVFQD